MNAFELPGVQTGEDPADTARTQSTLEGWVEEFRVLHLPGDATLRVMTQDGADGADTGLVGYRMPNSPTEIYVQPLVPGGAEWGVTFEPRDESVTLPAAAVKALATDMETLAALCTFLQAKSVAARGGNPGQR